MIDTSAQLLGKPGVAAPGTLDLRTRALQGGLVARAVRAVTARYRDPSGKRRVQHWVVKELDGRARREAAIYQALARTPASRLAPSLLAVEAEMDDVIRLYIERIDVRHRWPWGDVAAIASVLRSLAQLHDLAPPELAAVVADWDYEQELEQRGLELLDAIQHHRSPLQSTGIELRLHTVRRVAHHLPRWRRELWRYAPLARTVIHGDVHSGNVLLGRGKAVDLESYDAPILIDWERARLGSPLEDVSSWLQSLGFWEPEARRRHDTLLGEYLRFRGLESTPSRSVRDLYWLAAASNCLSGSLLYHVERAVSLGLGDERPAALRAVRDQLRILRRVEDCWG
jgi:hypothetical protein